MQCNLNQKYKLTKTTRPLWAAQLFVDSVITEGCGERSRSSAIEFVLDEYNAVKLRTKQVRHYAFLTVAGFSVSFLQIPGIA
jgi:hypothetical protein